MDLAERLARHSGDLFRLARIADALAVESAGLAHAAGATWPVLSAETELSASALRGRIQAADPETTWAHLRERRGERPPAKPELPGVDLSEASRILGKSWPTIDSWVKTGRIPAVRLADGRTRRVLTEEDGTIPVAEKGTYKLREMQVED